MIRKNHLRVCSVCRAVALILLLVTAGCKCGERTTMNGGSVPDDLTIIFGQQGVFAGRSIGYTISADGVLVRWEGKYPGEHEGGRAQLDAGELRRLWERIEDTGFLGMQYQAMTTEGFFVNVTADGESRRVVWTPNSDDLPEGVQELYQSLDELARSALDDGNGR